MTKIPQYVELRSWDRAIELSLQTYDTNMMMAVLDKIQKMENIDSFCKIISKHREAQSLVIEYLKTYHKELLEKYLQDNDLHEQLMYMYIENYFLSNNVKERSEFLDSAKICLKQLEKTMDKDDFKFHQTYIQDLENTMKFKRDCLAEGFLKSTDITNLDRSVFSFFYELISNERLSFMEGKNKQYFDVGGKKINIIRMKSYADGGHIEAIRLLNVNLKPNVVSYIAFAEICLRKRLYDQSVGFLSKVEDEDYFDYKLSMLKYMERYSEALEVIISNKDLDRKADHVEEILNKNEGLKYKVEELCSKYKVQL